MGAYEELKEQRDFLLENTWVQGNMMDPDAGCLMFRGYSDRRPKRTVWRDAHNILIEVTGHTWAPDWNDTECQSAGEAISVLEEAMRIAKERGLTDGA